MDQETPISRLPVAQLLWLDVVLNYLLESAPFDSDFRPYVWGGHIDELECREALRDQVAQCGFELFKAVLAFSKTKKWPRLSKQAKFELRERLRAGTDLVDQVSRAGARYMPGLQPEEPPECSQVVKDVVWGYWDDTASHQWAKKNSSCIARPFDWYSEEEQREMGY